MSIFLLTDSKVITKNEKSYISSVTCVNLKKASMASRNIVIKNNTFRFKSALQQSLDFSFLGLYILADQISFLEIQNLQLAGSSSMVFPVNLTLYYSKVSTTLYICNKQYHRNTIYQLSLEWGLTLIKVFDPQTQKVRRTLCNKQQHRNVLHIRFQSFK